MRRFVLQALAFTLLQLVVLLVVWQRCPRRDDHYTAAAIDKRLRLASAPAPRLVLVGGSATAFGTDSRVLAADGWIPVNMGHDLEFGLDFMLTQTRAHLREGDVVIVSPEYPLLWEQGHDDATLVTLLEHDPKSARYLSFTSCHRLLDGGLHWLGRKLRCALHGVSTEVMLQYSRASFDEYGDFAAHRDRPRQREAPLPLSWPNATKPKLGEPLDHAFALLHAFAEHCEAVGARCYFASSPLRPEQYEAGRAVIDHIEQRLAREPKLPVLLPPAAAVYPPEDFHDPGFHLTAEAARRRTTDLRARLRSTHGPPR